MMPTRSTSLTLALAAAVMLMPGAASALPSYALDIVPGDAQNNFNVPKFILTNLSTAGEEIQSFGFSIGDSGHFFDFVLDAGSSPAALPANLATEVATGASLVLGDNVNDRSGVSLLEWSFSDFQSGEELRFEVDVDPLSAQSGGSQRDDASRVFFDNGLAPNSQLQIVFSDGGFVDFELPDPNGGPLHFEGGFATVGGSVPEPGSMMLMGLGALGLAFMGRRSA